MDPISIRHLILNPFRILGLLGNATQVDIDSAARKFRLFDDPSLAPPNANQADWMGAVPRVHAQVEQAVSLLSQPQSRIEVRLWWFCAQPPDVELADPAPDDILAEHDAFLVSLYRALLRDSGWSDLDGWKSLLASAHHLAASEAYLAWLVDVETTGDFEKPATPQEIGAALARMPEQLAGAVLPAIEEALSRDDPAAVTAMLRVVVVVAKGQRLAPVVRIAARLEELVIGRCNTCLTNVDSAWETRLVKRLKPACLRAEQEYQNVIAPAYDALRMATANDPDSKARIAATIAGMLAKLGRAFEAMRDFVSAQRLYSKAQDIAAGTPIEPRIAGNLASIQAAVRQQRAGSRPLSAQSARAQTNAAPIASAPPASYRNYVGSGLSGIFSGRAVYLLVVVGIAALRFCSMGWQSSHRPNDTPPKLSVPPASATPANHPSPSSGAPSPPLPVQNGGPPNLEPKR